MRTLFKGGTIYDGTGRRPFNGDVLIEDDRIVKIAESIEETADKTIDISGYQMMRIRTTISFMTEKIRRSFTGRSLSRA